MQQPMPHEPPRRPVHRRLTRAEIRRRRRRRAARRLAVLVCALAIVAGGGSFAVNRIRAGSAASAASSRPEAGSIAPASSQSAASSAASQAPAQPQNALGLTAAEASAMLADPRMVLVNHDTPMPEDYTFDTKECGSSTAINKTLQTEAADAFLKMQAAARRRRHHHLDAERLPQRGLPDHPLQQQDPAVSGPGLRRGHRQGDGGGGGEPPGLFRAQLRPGRRPELPRLHRPGHRL